ncbi:glutamate-gated kainate-type ion channel receptor subunit GluR16 [Trifolium pratense]|uniref:Glutamate-gated kainate-type ion channel receptor subunit GluR16 n=1 Tax=Trifolium pratense TaxID=57577 RepID=A0A2K3M5M9_TRIPR|nr:glutamate-gated kainate-type ion channel receptor subunit GluR16 [Trifolium pratense]
MALTIASVGGGDARGGVQLAYHYRRSRGGCDLIFDLVPLKVSVLTWRLLRNQLPTKDNLVQRNIISHDSQFCVTGCLETAQHLFLSCTVFAPLWGLVRSWVGMSSVDSASLQDHFRQFIYSTGGARASRSFMQLVWLCCISVL